MSTKEVRESVLRKSLHAPPMKGARLFLPKTFGTMKVSPEERDVLHEQAIETFIAVSNTGVSFQDALVSVYLSGLDAGFHIGKGIDSDEH